MLTQCPNCQTVFRVTSAILRAAHGQVRCGQCNSQFDAIEHLLDGEEAEAAEVSADNSEAEASQDYTVANITHEDIVLEGNRIEISGVYPNIDADQTEEPATRSRTVIEEFNIGTEEWQNPFDQPDDTELADSEMETELEDVEQELNASSLADAIASLDADAGFDTNAIAGAATTGRAEPAAALFQQPIAPLPISTATEPTKRINRVTPLELAQTPFAPPATESKRWMVAGAALCLLLIGQVLHHSRAALARHPTFGPQLSKVYAALGHPLTPEWQLQAYSIKQWGIVSDPQQPGTLRVRASVTNGASFAQPYPLLQLSLEDRFGGKVGTRDFRPNEYLGSDTQATRLLSAGEAANIDLTIVDPGQDAVGFQFDTCLQLSHGLQCTHDLPAR